MNIIRTANTTTALLLAAAFTVSADAQVAVQQDGTARDASRQVGSNGINTPLNQPDYAARNLLITGNAVGGRAFRGQINYTNPGAFRGNLGSDTLFNFRRDSIYSAPGAQGLSTSPYGGNVTLTRPTTAYPGLSGAAGSLNYRAQYNPQTGVLTYRGSGGGLVSVSGVRGLEASQLLSGRGSQLGLVRTPNGIVSIDASPLTGIRYNALDADRSANRLLPGTTNASNFNPLSTRNSNQPPAPPTEEQELEEQRLRGQSLLNRDRRIDNAYNPAGSDLQALGLNLPEDPLSVSLGTQLQSAQTLKLAGRTDNNIPNSQAMLIRNQVFGPSANIPDQPATAPAAPEAPTDPYKKLIADILAQGKKAQEGQDNQANEGVQPDWERIFQKPEKEKADATKQQREEAVRRAMGMVDENGNVDFETPLPGIDPESELGKLLTELSYDLPRMKTLTGDNANRLNKLMAQGEKQLKDGKYLAAETIYRQVLLEKPKDPLAKSGLVHAQMGAGMIRSAAFNLRSLFSDHPELIALRYDAKLMPNNERLRWLQDRVTVMMGQGNRGADPGLILAYLGYQLNAKPLVEFGLDHAQSIAPRDPLMPLLRQIWIKGEKPQPKKQDDKPAEQPQPEANEATAEPAK